MQSSNNRGTRQPIGTGPVEVNETAHPDHLRLAPNDHSPGVARRFVRRMFAEHGLGSTEAAHNAQVVTSEVVTNAVNAVRTDLLDLITRGQHWTILVSVCFHLRERRVVIRVWDCSPRPVVRHDLDLTSENGRGLVIIEAYSKEWGITSEHGGKAVWFVIGLD